MEESPFFYKHISKTPRDGSQKGNALFLILVALALFAALAYAVTQSGRGGGSATAEQVRIDLAQLFTYDSAIAQAILRMKLVNGCTDAQISFENTVYVDTFANIFDTGDGRCRVFDPAGGGLPYQSPSTTIRFPVGGGYASTGVHFFTGGNQINGVGTSFPEAGPADEGMAELIHLARITKEACLAFNQSLGIPMGSATEPPTQTTVCDGAGFRGYYNNVSTIPGQTVCTIGRALQTSNLVIGKPAFCVLESSSGSYYYINTLLAR